ncbi:MAG: hypothetical protein A2V70_13275 [Planctomycetes bacterium RBG_13_63_9]|nr:MAG: hypothetical protein A2V70_13275 [Planctomycetes bacterium RBG_13_63_9]
MSMRHQTDMAVQQRFPAQAPTAQQPPAAEEPATVDMATETAWPEPKQLLQHLDELASAPETAEWATAVRQLLQRVAPAASQGPAELRSVLRRLKELTAEVGPMADRLAVEPLARKLRRAGYALRRRVQLWQQLVWTGNPGSPLAETDDRTTLLARLEQYEETGLASDGRALAEAWQRIGPSATDDRSRPADPLEAYYRNANVRVEVSAELLNRLMPQQKPETAPVRDTVLGKPVFGQRLTSAAMRVRLLPDPNRVRMELEVTGEVDASTHSTSGPATFYSDSTSEYVARKPLRVDLTGIHSAPAKAEVDHSTHLRNVRTDFDGIPLFGAMVTNMARSKYQKKRPEADAEVRWKVATRALRQVDSEADARLGKASEKLQRQLLDPLDNLALDPQIISSQTTEQQAAMRVRLAGRDQLGSHTPRPRVPPDSLASFQVHETAINNALERLELDGQTFTVAELAHHIAAKLNRPESWDVDPEEADVLVTFAEKDAANVRCRDGQVVLCLSIARLRKPPRQWTNFQALVVFQPRAEGVSADLVRQESVHLTGRQFRTSSRMALHGIFSRVFPKQRPVHLTPDGLLDNPKLAGLAIIQLVAEDGWIGAALGSQKTARRDMPNVSLDGR